MKIRPRTSWLRWGWAGLWVSVITFASISPAQAQDDGPVLITKRQKMDKFGLNHIKAQAKVIYHYQRDESTNNSNVTNVTNVTENNLRETFSLSADSYVIHPNLVDIKLQGSFGLVQNSSASENGGSLSTIQSYNVSATFLRKETAPLTLFAQQSISQVHSQFSGTTQNTDQTYGAAMSIRSLRFPSQFRLEHRATTQDDPTNRRNFQTLEDTFTWSTNYQPSENQKLNLNYTYDSKNQTGSSTNIYQSHELIAYHELKFGPDEHYKLNSNFNYFQQAGTIQLQRWRLDEMLDMQHSTTFRTQSRYSYSQEQRTSTEQSTHRASTGFTHKLYKSVITTGRVGVVSTDNAGQGTHFENYANMQIDYRKQIPYGLLNINLSANFSQVDDSRQSSLVNVFDEPYVYTDPIPITINRRNIISGTITVRSETFFDYTEGLDYTLSYLTDYVRLTVPVGSSITDGQTLLITYTATADPSNKTTTLGQGVSIRYAIDKGFLKGLDLYANFYQQHQTISSSEPLTFPPDQITDITYGMNYRIGKLTFNAQRRSHDSVFSPYLTSEFSARYRNKLSKRTSIYFSAAYIKTDYFDQDNQTQSLQFSGHMTQQLSRNLYLSVGAAYRKERDNIIGNTQAHEQTLELRWKRRQTNVYITGRNAITTGDTQNILSQMLEIGIYRTF